MKMRILPHDCESMKPGDGADYMNKKYGMGKRPFNTFKNKNGGLSGRCCNCGKEILISSSADSEQKAEKADNKKIRQK